VVTVNISHDVKDFEAWHSAFKDHAGIRANGGSKTSEVWHSADQPNTVSVTLNWESKESFATFMESDDVRSKMEAAGVVSAPTVTFLTPVGSYDS